MSKKACTKGINDYGFWLVETTTISHLFVNDFRKKYNNHSIHLFLSINKKQDWFSRGGGLPKQNKCDGE